MKAEEIRYILLKNGKIAFGEVNEVEIRGKKFYDITGAYFYREAQEGDCYYEPEHKVCDAIRVQNNMQPFSQVGRFIQKARFPEDKVEIEILDMPPLVSQTLIHVFQSETRNAEIRQKLLNMPIPSRSNMSPEEAISQVAKYLDKHGELPSAKLARGVLDNQANVIVGNFDRKKTSPYAEEAEKVSEVS